MIGLHCEKFFVKDSIEKGFTVEMRCGEFDYWVEFEMVLLKDCIG